MSRLFLDTAYAIALSSVTDHYHEKAFVLAEQIEIDGISLITTRAIMLEIGNALSRLRYRAAAL